MSALLDAGTTDAIIGLYANAWTFGLSPPFTFGGWVYPTSAVDSTVFSLESSVVPSEYNIQARTTFSGTLWELLVTDDSSQKVQSTLPNKPVTLNAWNFLCILADPSLPHIAQLYVNDSQNPIEDVNVSQGTSLPSPNYLAIGNMSNDATDAMGGYLCNCFLYERLLSPREIDILALDLHDPRTLEDLLWFASFEKDIEHAQVGVHPSPQGSPTFSDTTHKSLLPYTPAHHRRSAFGIGGKDPLGIGN